MDVELASTLKSPDSIRGIPGYRLLELPAAPLGRAIRALPSPLLAYRHAVETTYANRGGSGGSCKIAIGINREYGHTSVGWVVNPVSAGFVAGLLAALAGVSMLELHCSNFQTLHVLVWHTLVVPVSGAIGAFLGWVVSEYVSDGR